MLKFKGAPALTAAAAIAAAVLQVCQPAHAQDRQQQRAERPTVSSIDPNTFIVGHPASPTWAAPHANGHHPAVLVFRQAHLARVDSNQFIVQPPVQVSWTVQPAPVLTAQVSR